MTTIKISASCPYEIGDKIVTGREIPAGTGVQIPGGGPHDHRHCVPVQRADRGSRILLYELDGRGPLVRLEAPPRKKKRK